jgi:glycosyltransferase involved in cell wall biosynthesis
VGPGVIITHNLRGWGFAPWIVAAERGIPLVHVVHDYSLLCNSATLWNRCACDRVCAPCIPRRDAARRRWPGGQWVGVSQAVLDEHERRGLGEMTRSALVMRPVAAAGVRELRMAPRPSGVPKTIGYLGRMDDAKGLPLMLLATRTHRGEVLVAGNGDESYVDSLRSMSGPHVRWLGWVEPASFLDRIDVLVVPSAWREPFGLVVVEAARAGVPVLLADQPGLVEAACASGAQFATFRANDSDSLQLELGRDVATYTRSKPLHSATGVVDLIASLAIRPGSLPSP